MLSGGLKHSFHAQEIYQLEPWVNSFGQRQTPANVRRAGERHKIIRQIDFGSGVDAGASSGGPLSPDLTFAHQAFSSWPLPWVRFSTLAPNTGVHRNLLLHPVPNGTSLGDKKKKKKGGGENIVMIGLLSTTWYEGWTSITLRNLPGPTSAGCEANLSHLFVIRPR